MLARGAGGVVTKSIGPQPKDGHTGPCVTLLGEGILNAMGLPNPSREFTGEISTLRNKPVIVSIFGGNPAEFVEVAGWFKGMAAGVELNLSCPHAEGYGAAIGVDPDLVEKCTREVRALGMPTWVKLTPNVTDIKAIGKAETRGGNCYRGYKYGKSYAHINCIQAPVLGNRYGALREMRFSR